MTRASSTMIAAFAVLASGSTTAVLALGASACSSTSTATEDPEAGAGPIDAAVASCPNDLPAACPTDVPSFAGTIAPLLERRCLGCHSPGGVVATKFDFSTYQGVFSHRSAVLNQVYACHMPPADAGALVPEERAELLTWLVCHAPEN
jgi:hypothetical protein